MTECPCRDNDVAENLDGWQKMNDPDGYQPGDAVPKSENRYDTEKSSSPRLARARIQINAHPRVGNKWRVGHCLISIRS